MQTLTFTNANGDSIEAQDMFVAYNAEYRLMSFMPDPLNSPAVTDRGYQQDGLSYKYSRAEPRMMTLRVQYRADGYEAMREKENELRGIFNPRLDEGTLVYEDDYWSKTIAVKVEAEPIFPRTHNYSRNIFSVLLTAYYPFWSDIAFTDVNLVGVSGGFYWTSPTYFTGDFYLGDITGSSAQASNIGHLPAPLRIEWTGVATDPKITLEDTGEFILLDGSLTSDQRLIITTGYNNKKVYIQTISTGVITEDNSLIDSTSTFFSLPIGTSTLSFSATSGGSDSVVVIRYKQLFIGV